MGNENIAAARFDQEGNPIGGGGGGETILGLEREVNISEDTFPVNLLQFGPASEDTNEIKYYL